MDLSLKVCLTGWLMFTLSLPFFRGEYPENWVAVPLFTCFFGGLAAMVVGGLLSIWGSP